MLQDPPHPVGTADRAAPRAHLDRPSANPVQAIVGAINHAVVAVAHNDKLKHVLSQCAPLLFSSMTPQSSVLLKYESKKRNLPTAQSAELFLQGVFCKAWFCCLGSRAGLLLR